MSSRYIPPAPARDVRGAPVGERLSDYFDFERFPDKAEKKVTRMELLAVMTQLERGRKQNTFRSRLWRFLKAPRGSGPVHATESPT